MDFLTASVVSDTTSSQNPEDHLSSTSSSNTESSSSQKALIPPFFQRYISNVVFPNTEGLDLSTIASMRFTTTRAEANPRRLSVSMDQLPPIFSERRFSDVEMINDEDSPEGNSSNASSGESNFYKPEYLESLSCQPNEKRPLFFFSNVYIEGRKKLGENNEDYQERMRLEYKISSVTVKRPQHKGPYAIAVRSLDGNELYPPSLEFLENNSNDQLLATAGKQLVEELPSTQDSTNTEIPSDLKLSSGKHISQIAIAETVGKRSKMEDRHSDGCFELFGKNVNFVALYDGHEGETAAEFCAKYLPKFTQKRLKIELAETFLSYQLPIIHDALTLATVDLSHSYYNHANSRCPKDGSTVNAAYMIDKRLWIQNVGDSRAMLVGPQGQQILLSEDAHPNKERFRKEVEERRGSIDATNNRVSGSIAVTRTIGDHRIRGLSARADVCFVNCPTEGWEDWYLVQTCDGIHERNLSTETVAVASRDVGHMVYRGISNGIPLKDIAKEIVETAYRRGSEDNLSVIITPLEKI